MPDVFDQRLRNWGQTPHSRLPDSAAGARFIARVGLATLFPASPEIPNLFHAYMGSPDVRTDSGHDTPSGHAYGWRWELGRAEVGFYTAIVRKRPTWVSWSLLPSIIRLLGDPRTPDELYDLGAISADAHRIAHVLEEAGGTLTTGELRREAGFPVGKEQRAAYLKAVEELDTRLLLAKVFAPNSIDMGHALVSVRYPNAIDTASRLSRADALEQFLATYLPQAVYAAPMPLAKHVRIPETELRAGLDRLAAAGMVGQIDRSDVKGASHVWNERDTGDGWY